MKALKYLIYSALILVTAVNLWYFADSFWPVDRSAKASSFEQSADVTMYKNAGCQCCTRWADYLRENNYTVNEKKVTNLPAIRNEKGIPANMGSCHTAVIDGYVVEGHVPVEDIRKLVRQKPEAVGLAAPGMPQSAPGMNTALNKPYTVHLVKDDGSSRVFAEH